MRIQIIRTNLCNRYKLTLFLGGFFFHFSCLGKESEILRVNSAGDSFGLKLTMSVEQEEYLGHDTPSAGLKMRVHNQDELPFVSNLGFALMPGSHVFAAISKTRVSIFIYFFLFYDICICI